MTIPLLRFFLWAALVGLSFARPATTPAAQEPQVSATLSTPLVKLGGKVNLVVVVDDAREAELLEVPAVEGLEFSPPGRPVTTHQSMIVNGRVYEQNRMEWVIRVLPREAGDYAIPPLRVRVDGEERTVPDAPLALRVIADTEGAEVGFVEFVDLPERVYEGQPFLIDLRFGWDQDLPLAEAKPYLPWWDGLRGVLELEAPRPGAGKQFDLIVNDQERVRVEELDPAVRDGRVMRRLRLVRRVMATRPGDLQLDAGTFQFAELLERGIGFRPDKVKRYYAQLAPARIAVLPVPEQGRPLEWTGAVGHVSAERRVDRRDVDEGDAITLTVSWFGDANLEFFEAPDLSRLDGFRDFRVLGIQDEKAGDERRVTFELLPATDEVSEIPPVPLWVFDPELERFVLVESEPITIRVRPVEDDLTGYDDGVAVEVLDLRDLHVEPVVGEDLRAPGGGALGLSFLGVVGAWFALRTVVRRRGDPDSPRARRRRRARRELDRGLRGARSAREQGALLARFLAARTGESDAAWVGRDPREWAAERGEIGGIDELAGLLDALDEEAWAGGDRPLDRARVQRVADTLLKGGL